MSQPELPVHFAFWTIPAIVAGFVTYNSLNSMNCNGRVCTPNERLGATTLVAIGAGVLGYSIGFAATNPEIAAARAVLSRQRSQMQSDIEVGRALQAGQRARRFGVGRKRVRFNI